MHTSCYRSNEYNFLTEVFWNIRGTFNGPTEGWKAALGFGGIWSSFRRRRFSARSIFDRNISGVFIMSYSLIDGFLSNSDIPAPSVFEKLFSLCDSALLTCWFYTSANLLSYHIFFCNFSFLPFHFLEKIRIDTTRLSLFFLF